MRLLMISGDRSVLQGKKGAFWYTLEEFSKHWDRVDVITPRVKGSNLQVHPFRNVWFYPSSHGLWYQLWWILLKGDELIKEHHHDVMTVHEYPPFYNGLGARWLQRSTGIPSMTEIHHIVGYPQAASLPEVIGRWLSRLWIPWWGTSQAAAVRVVNEETKSVLQEWGVPPERIKAVHSLYLDAEALKPDPTIAKRYDVAFCARLVPNKGLPELLEAVSKLPAVTLLIIGDGPECIRNERLAQTLGIADRVTFRGWLPTNQDVYRAIQSARMFVMNSKSEGGPRVVVEAMALGLPVIATNVGVVPEVIRDGENGLITTGTPEDIAQNIQTLLSNDALRARLGHSAREILQRFERKKLIWEYAEFLQSIV